MNIIICILALYCVFCRWNWIWNVSIFKQIRRGFQPASTSLFAVLKMKTRAPHSFAQVFHERETKGEISSRFFFSFSGLIYEPIFSFSPGFSLGRKKLNGHWLHEALAKSLHVSYAVSYFYVRERPLMTSDIRVGRGVLDSPQNQTLESRTR